MTSNQRTLEYADCERGRLRQIEPRDNLLNIQRQLPGNEDNLRS